MKFITKKSWLGILCAMFILLISSVARADDASAINSGDTAWMLISTALVMLMTPGLAFFYMGMVGTKNAVGTLFL